MTEPLGHHLRMDASAVTNFRRSNIIYAAAMAHNKGLDPDKDKIACEKA
jgi:hypothetical protein